MFDQLLLRQGRECTGLVGAVLACLSAGHLALSLLLLPSSLWTAANLEDGFLAPMMSAVSWVAWRR